MQTTQHFAWRDSYTVGNGMIDGQHQTLLQLASLLHEAIRAGKGYHVIHNAYEGLVLYTREHFRAEERLWVRSKSLSLESHKQQHTELIRELAALRQDGPFGPVFCTPLELSEWVVNRLVRHILHDDQDAYAAVQNKGDIAATAAPLKAAGLRQAAVGHR